MRGPRARVIVRFRIVYIVRFRTMQGAVLKGAVPRALRVGPRLDQTTVVKQLQGSPNRGSAERAVEVGVQVRQRAIEPQIVAFLATTRCLLVIGDADLRPVGEEVKEQGGASVAARRLQVLRAQLAERVVVGTHSVSIHASIAAE